MDKLADPGSPEIIEIGPADLLPRLKDNGYDEERVGRRRTYRSSFFARS